MTHNEFKSWLLRFYYFLWSYKKVNSHGFNSFIFDVLLKQCWTWLIFPSQSYKKPGAVKLEKITPESLSSFKFSANFCLKKKAQVVNVVYAPKQIFSNFSLNGQFREIFGCIFNFFEKFNNSNKRTSDTPHHIYLYFQ